MSKARLDQLERRIHQLESGLQDARKELNSLRNEAPASTPSTKEEFKKPEQKGKPWVTSVFEILGENLLGRLGILTVLVATGWFLMYAFQNRWINESGRIYLALFGASISLLISYWLAIKKVKYLPVALAGMSVAVLYLGIYSAYFFYNFLPNTETFIYLASLSLLTAFVSYRLQSETLFGFALAGILLAPVLLSTGENSYRFLYTYLLLLHILFAAIFSSKPARISGTLLLIGTNLIFFFWADANLSISNPWIPFLFLILVETLFVWRILRINSLGLYSVYDSILLAAGILIYAIASLYAISEFTEHYGLVWLLQAWLIALPVLYPGKHLKSINSGHLHVLLYSMILFVFAAITEITGDSLLTLSWILLAGVLSAVSLSRNLWPVLIPAMILYFLSFVRLVFYETTSYGSIAILNTSFGLNLLLALSLGYNYFILPREERTTLSKFFVWSAFIVLILASLSQVSLIVEDYHYINLGRSYVLAIYCVLFLLIGFKLNSLVFRRAGIGLAVLIMIKFYFYDVWTMSLPVRIIAAFTLGGGLIALSFFYQKIKVRLLESLRSEKPD